MRFCAPEFVEAKNFPPSIWTSVWLISYSREIRDEIVSSRDPRRWWSEARLLHCWV